MPCTTTKKHSRRKDPHQRPSKKQKRNPESANEVKMPYFPSATATTTSKKLLAVPPALSSRNAGSRLIPTMQNQLDAFLSSDADIDLEVSFASTMSIQSPPRNFPDLPSENDNPDYAPMDISPAPQRIQPHPSKGNAGIAKPVMGRPRAFTSGPRLFGRDMSNGNASVTSLPSVASSGKSIGTGGGSKRLQRTALPTEWIAPAANGQNDNDYTQPLDIPSSPSAADPMDVDSSFVFVPSTSAPQAHSPLSAAPTVAAFDVENNPLLSSPIAPASAAPTVTQFDYFSHHAHLERSSDGPEDDDGINVADVSYIAESPAQLFPKKRRSSSPNPLTVRRGHQLIVDEEPSYDSSPAPSSPMASKLERLTNGPMGRKPMLTGLGAPLELNTNKKRPRRPILSAMLPPSENPVAGPRSAHPLTHGFADKENDGRGHVHELPPVRRAFSAMLPPNMLEQSLSSDDASFDAEADMSSPAQAYARRQQIKTIRRCDGTDDFRPFTGATALVHRDNETMMKSLKRSEDREDRTRERAERDTPRSKYLSGLGGFGDNEAHGKILPCHRVREDGLMRITCKTLDDLLDGEYDSKLASFHVIDCRFDYEYNGGHIPGAVNINTTTGVEEFLLGDHAIKPTPSTSGDISKKTVLIFHCEFSVKRAPTFAKHLRSKDRALNNHVYPRIHYPEVYILDGGYSQYFQESAARCQPTGYIKMDDPHYAASRKEDLDQFRKGKFGRTKSYAYGEGKMTSLMSQQAKRNTAPSGNTNTLFAAANAARTRRGGLGNTGLQMLAEDGNLTQHSEDEDTDIGDSPCPQPSKGVNFKGKKIGRLVKAETYGPSRMALGY
ncbi:hypothetical protein AcV7_009248 [Taiwanofungus camphoratus]|nr:hypothetical protein AcV7_009248 [Antrodia cinnamomea]